MKEVPVPQAVIERKVIPFRQNGVSFMIYEGLDGLTHLDRDFRPPVEIPTPLPEATNIVHLSTSSLTK